ncbi:hypothetical protein BDQ17DRAFT_1345612 [Cyathus striatus]|nr:hypothetical protein BDQ17DRAFT_1345612 [Cyathus striatus]
MGKGGKGLKAALQSQQSRQKLKEKAVHAAAVAEQKLKKKQKGGVAPGAPSSASNAKGKQKANAKRPTIPFKPTDKILLIGEGNFSFAQALIDDPPSELEGIIPQNITATAYDTEVECYEKYPDAHAIVSNIKQKGVKVLFGVDGTKLEKTAGLKGKKFDRVVWNFPHAGMGITDQDRNIFTNQVLILGFLRSAANMLTMGPVPSFTTPRKKKKLSDDDDDDVDVRQEEVAVASDDEYQFFTPDETVKSRGTILITLRNVVPYTQWDVPKLAKNPRPPTGSTPPNPSYTQLRSFAFHREIWKGYEHRMTKGERAHGTGKTGEGGEDRTWEFCLRD